MTAFSKGSNQRSAVVDNGMAENREQDLVVSSARSGIRPLLLVGFFTSVAGILLFGLNAGRTQVASLPVTTAAMPLPPLPPLDIPQPTPPSPVPVQPAPVVMSVVQPPRPAPPPQAPDDTEPRLRAPAVIVDEQPGQLERTAPNLDVAVSAPGATPLPLSAKPASDLGGAALAAAAMTGPTSPGVQGGIAPDANPNLKFAARLAQDSPDVSVATQTANLKTTIIQGSTIQALLETAINSDLPGYARAIVRRDVLGFDGKAVLIPRGSRVIGQYRNAMALGESRVFVLWTRIIRPDGVSVQIGSPGADALGQGGLTGEVSTHFFERFSGAILLSVLNAGVNAVSGTPQAEIAIGSPAAAIGAAATATVPAGGTIPPTIKVGQGSAVTIFVARDLDFSTVKSVQ